MAAVEIKNTKIFINNEFVDSASGKTFPTFNPATGKLLAEVAEGDKADIDLAVAAARKAFAINSEWRSTFASTRGELLNKLAELIARDTAYLARLETLDNGKPLSNATEEMGFCCSVLRYYAGKADKIHGDTIPADGEVLTLTLKEPVGVCGQIIPWNYPLPMAIWKIGPAIAAGCTVVLKPAEQTPLSALYLGSLVAEAGFPPGVINIVPGYGPTAGAALSAHMDVDKVAFTGSTEVGRLVMEAAAKSNLKRITLELGGKSPLVVFADADVDKAAQVASEGALTNHGQCCCAATRTYVHSSIYDAFVEKSKVLAEKRTVGNPFDDSTIQGPQIDEDSMKKVLKYVDIGVKQGAKLVTGGKRVGNAGFFVQPTVFADVNDDMDISKDEIFGPVQSIHKFETFEEAVERANNTSYGLAAGCMTNNIETALRFAKQVRAGSLWINLYDHISAQTPFGGFKQSGLGRELGPDGIEGYLETKTVTINLPNKALN